MKYLFLVFLLHNFIINPIFGQEMAITENKDTVYLYSNGTWSYELSDDLGVNGVNLHYLNTPLNLDTILVLQKKTDLATGHLESKLGIFSINYLPEKWKRTPPGQLNAEAEFALLHKEKEIYCIVIAEEVGVGFENMPKIAMKTMEKNTGGTIEVKKAELRNVNGVNVTRGVFDIEISGMNLTFDSYYYSSEKGSIQFTTWTGSNIWGKHEPDILELLNGLVIKQ